MSSAMMMERTAMTMPGVGVPGIGVPAMGTPAGVPAGVNYMVVPRCSFKVEKVQGGVKISCACEDKTACSMVQNLCSMLAGGMCSCCCMLNGTMVYYCNFTMGMCKCEPTPKGVCITCTSGDAECCKMLQGCCDCLSAMLHGGCMCCVMMNNTPVCCGCC